MRSIYWAAEVGSMHKGEISLAYELIRQAKHAGATAVKFQAGWDVQTQAKYGLTYKKERYIDEWLPQLVQFCKIIDIEFFASVWSRRAFNILESLQVETFKIAHQFNEPELLKDIIDTDQIVFVSNPNPEIITAGNVFPIFCPTQYPTYPGEIVQPQYSSHGDGKMYWYGYSDHCHGIAPCLMAAHNGALYIEKHFCLDKADLTVRDTPFAATPDEFRQMVNIGNDIRSWVDAAIYSAT